MLEDVQERLVYRTHIYIQTDITGYKPAPGDLAYPDKLEMMEVSNQLLLSLIWFSFYMQYIHLYGTVLCRWDFLFFLGVFNITGAIKEAPADEIMTLKYMSESTSCHAQ